MARVYCAGPLFNDPEKEEMAAIAAQLESAGHQTFLPQRDGIELSEVERELDALQMDSADIGDLLHRAIFCLDVYKLLGWSEAVVANLNGRGLWTSNSHQITAAGSRKRLPWESRSPAPVNPRPTPGP